MSIFTPQLKHHILTQYRANDRDWSFQSLAVTYGIKGGKSTIKKWHQQWNGTPQSLERKVGSGRPSLLTNTQVYKYISQPIIKKNRQHKPIHYTKLLPSIQSKTGHPDISLRTVQRIGKQLQIKKTRGIKRCAEESKLV
jgi:transposase